MGFTAFDTGLSKGANITLSNSNLTATASASGTATGVSGTNFKLAGKWYFEVSVVTLGSIGTVFTVGIRVPGSTAIADPMTAYCGRGGAITVNGTGQTGTTAPGSSSVYGVAVDLDNMRIWFRTDTNNWNGNGSADPATNVGGYDISAFCPASGVYPFLTLNSSNAGTANFGASAFAHGPPSGFSGWSDSDGNTVGIDLDSYATAQATNASITLTLPGTNGTDRIIVVGVESNVTSGSVNPVNAVSGGSLTWHKHTAFTYTGTSGSNRCSVEIWWAHAPSLLGSTNITISWSGGYDDSAAGCFAVSGADTTTPFDTDASIPATNTNTASSSPSVTGISTQATHGILIGVVGNDAGPSGSGGPTAPTNFAKLYNRVNSGGSKWALNDAFAKGFTTARSSVAITTTGSFADWGMIGTAIVAAATGTSGTWGSTEDKDVFAGVGGLVGGPWASTEAKDVFAGTGGIIGSGSLSATEDPDVMAFVGSTLGGSLAAVESQDIWAGAGYPALTGTWASTEAKDALAATGHVLAVDGFAHNQSTTSSITSGTVTLTTTSAHDVIVLCCTTKGGSISSVSDVAGLTWTKRTKFNPSSNSTEDMEIWWAHAPTALAADVITIHFSSTNGFAAVAFGVTGANTGTPFDTHNANSVTVDNGGAGNPTASLTTDLLRNQLVFGFLGSDDGGGQVTSVSTGLNTFLDHDGNGTNAPHAAVGYVLKPTKVTSLSLAFTQNGGTFNDRYLMVDSIVAAVDVSGTLAATEVKDTFAGTGYPQLTGTWTSVETRDSFDGSIYLPPRGTFDATEAKDTMAFTGTAAAPLGIDVIDGFGSHNTTTASKAITTAYPNEVIVVAVVTGGFFNRAKVDSVTDTAGLTWHKRHQRWQKGSNPSMEIWWAKKTLPGATTITVTTEATTGFLACQVFGITGARVDQPWDTHTGAGYYYDNLGSGNPAASLYSNASKGLALAFFGSNEIGTTGAVTSDFIWAESVTAAETSGQTGRLESAVQLFTTPYVNTTVQFGQVGGGALNRAIMTDIIVAANESPTTVSTDDVIRWFFDGHGNQQIVAMSGSNNTAIQTFTTYNNDTVAVVCAMIQSSLGSRVDHIEDDAGHSAWTQRSRVANASGSLAMEVWWCQFDTPFSGNVRVVLDSNVQPGDILGFTVVGINGPDLFLRGEIWDGDASLPNTASAEHPSHPHTGPFSTLNENVLELNFAGNTGSDTNDGDPTGFNELPWLQFAGDFFGSKSGMLVSGSPNFNISTDFKFSATPVEDEEVELNPTPSPANWLMIADAMPVGPVSPPTGTWHSTEAKDVFRHTGDFTSIGIASPGGWVGFPQNDFVLDASEAKDYTTNSGAFTAIWDINGWIAYIPAFMSMDDVEADDTLHLGGWVIGPTTILARFETVELPDRLGFSGPHAFYTAADSTGDRTSRITVSTNASLGGGTIDNLVDGLKANGTGSAIFVNDVQAAPMYFRFDFGSPRLVTEAKWYQNGPSAQPGTWKWQGSQDAASWTDLSAAFTLNAGGAGDVIGDMSANVTEYRYYQMIQNTNLGGNSSPWLWEIEFKVGCVSGAMAVTEAKDRSDFQYRVIPIAQPIPARKRRTLIVS